ncbi:MAG: hypothetical protein V2I43_09745 [Parvularcula sp.]|jgi:hypothetical protein|nr:hypothetical protein [Parvularcula sp.]
MSIGRASIDLWRRSRPFRALAAATAFCTVLAVITGLRGGSAPPSNPVGNLNSNAGIGHGGSASPATPASCGPPSQPQKAVPSVVAGPSGGVPANVSVPQGAGTPTASGPPADVVARFRQFVTRVDAAAREQREGERCARMSDAISLLETTDYAWADCFADGPDKLVLAQDCSANFADSEARFERLREAANAVAEDRSAPRLERLADARAAMTPFDRTREAWAAANAQVEAGDLARGELDASTARIARLEAAAASVSEPMTPAEAAALAQVGRLTSFDLARLSPEQEQMVARARDAVQRLSESDARFERLAAALASLSEEDPAARDALIAAVSRLDAFDLARANPAQSADIAQAKASATRFALDDLVAAAAGVDPAVATAAQLDRLRDLRAVILENDMPETLTLEQTAALETGRMAAARRDRSDRRLAEMRAIVDRVETGGPAALGEDVLRIYDSLDELDQARMDEADRVDYAALGAARDITLATRDRTLTREVPVFVRGLAEGNETVDYAVDRLRSALRRDGFVVVDAEERSAVTFVVTRLDLEESNASFGSTTISGSVATIDLEGSWTFAEQAIRVPSASGQSSAFSGSATEEAIAEAITDLTANIAGLTQ